ncbi:MAG: hypothetical protein IPM20_13805 [Gammaproteobacteria bacterium]|nr:hypothetical protein [Gammaproteobacteria bacterium]
MVRVVLLVLFGCVLAACSEGKDYQLKVQVSGLNGTGLVLQNNGTETLTVNSGGVHAFPLDYPFAYPYKVTVRTNPTSPDQICVVENSEGRLTESVDNVLVRCTDAYRVSGTVVDLTGEDLIIMNNSSERLTIDANGGFTFARLIPDGGPYQVSVLQQPTKQLCTVENAAGSISGANITDVRVVCGTRTVGGTLSGLAGARTVVLQNNGTDNLTLAQNGAFAFATTFFDGADYAVTVNTQPFDQVCTVANASGTVAAANITDVEVACGFTVGGNITGPSGATVVLQNNGTDNLSLGMNRAFTFVTGLPVGATYNVTLLTVPDGLSCAIVNGSGTMIASPVGNVAVSCREGTTLSVDYGIKEVRLSWQLVNGVDSYRVMKSTDAGETYTQIGTDTTALSFTDPVDVHLNDWINLSYKVQSCVGQGADEVCTDSNIISPLNSARATGYFKASNTGAGDGFGYAVALSGDGNTLAAGAPFEDSAATGVDGDETDDCDGAQANCAEDSGAVYVFARDVDTGAWTQRAYLKASNTGAGDRFGSALELADDGATLVVGAPAEDSDASGVYQVLPHGAEDNDAAADSGAAYVFVRDVDDVWTQQAYVKASNTGAGDGFGAALALSGADGDTLAIGAPLEDSAATGLDGDEIDDCAGASLNCAADSGAAYVYLRSGTAWAQQAYVKASNTEAQDDFARAVALSDDGDTLAIGAPLENGDDGGGENNSGAAYVYARAGAAWSPQAYVKAATAAAVSDVRAGDSFGHAVALSGDGATLAVGAPFEDSAARSVDGDAADDCDTIVLVNCATDSGAAYVYLRAGATWSPQAYVKATNAEELDLFGQALRLTANGAMLAVGAVQEDSQTTGVGGEQSDNVGINSGAVYLFARDGTGWSDLAYAKESTSGEDDNFGYALDLSSDGTTLAASAPFEDSNATGVGGEVGDEQEDDSAAEAGAVYLF